MIAAYGAKQLSLAQGNKPVAGGKTPDDLQGIINDQATQISAVDPAMLPAIPYTITPPPATPAQ